MSDAGASPVAGFPGAGSGLVAATDQSRGGWIRIWDLGERFDTPPNPVWSWRPDGITGWGRPTDVRLRRHEEWGDVLLTSDSFGAILVVGDDGAVRWSTDVGAAANPHAIEIAAGRLVVTAMSTGGVVRTFDSVRGAEWAPVSLPGAHGLVWDESRRTLWALGFAELRAVQPVDEALSWRTVASAPLPTPDGHDLVPADAEGMLWVTTTSGVYRYDTARARWLDAGLPGSSRPRVKSIDRDPVSDVVTLTVPDEGRDPEWATSRITLLRQEGEPGETAMTFPDTQLYKARHWRPW